MELYTEYVPKKPNICLDMPPRRMLLMDRLDEENWL